MFIVEQYSFTLQPAMIDGCHRASYRYSRPRDVLDAIRAWLAK